jgi:hypothetical protein
MSNLDKSMSEDPKCTERGMTIFCTRAKKILNDFKGRLMTSKYETPFEFATDYRKTTQAVYYKVKLNKYMFVFLLIFV